MVRGCIQKLAEQTRLVNDLNVEQAQAASAEEKGLFGWMSSGYGMVVLVVLVVAAAIVGYFLLKGHPKVQAANMAANTLANQPIPNARANQPIQRYMQPSAPPVVPATGQQYLPKSNDEPAFNPYYQLPPI
jgi:hypothetical protein